MESVLVQRKEVERDGGTRASIVLKLLRRDPDPIFLPPSQIYAEVRHRVSPKLRVVHQAVNSDGAQSYISVVTEHRDSSVMEPSS